MVSGIYQVHIVKAKTLFVAKIISIPPNVATFLKSPTEALLPQISKRYSYILSMYNCRVKTYQSYVIEEYMKMLNLFVNMNEPLRNAICGFLY